VCGGIHCVCENVSFQDVQLRNARLVEDKTTPGMLQPTFTR
jgi:hypothetical protein